MAAKVKTSIVTGSSRCVAMIILCFVALIGCDAKDQTTSVAQDKLVSRFCGNLAVGSEFNTAMIQNMQKMDADMMTAPMTGDPAHDFSAMMIPHHQGAIEMAKAFLLKGKDPALRRLAEEIIVTQKQEIDVMYRRLV